MKLTFVVTIHWPKDFVHTQQEITEDLRDALWDGFSFLPKESINIFPRRDAVVVDAEILETVFKMRKG